MSENQKQRYENETRTLYKDGEHILIYVRLDTTARKYFLANLREEFKKTSVLNDVYSPEICNQMGNFRDGTFIDLGPASSPAMLYCNVKKVGAQPYRLEYIRRIDLNSLVARSGPRFEIIEFKTENPIYELSLFYGGGETDIIKKPAGILRREIMTILEEKNRKQEIDYEDVIRCSSLEDGKIEELKKLIQIMGQKISDSYEKWIRVLFYLAHLDKNCKKNDRRYYCLAIYFSKLSAKFDQKKFDQIWKSAYNLHVCDINLSTLEHYAQESNKTEYLLWKKNTSKNYLYRLCISTVGQFSNFEIAAILFLKFQSKFVSYNHKNETYLLIFNYPTEDFNNVEYTNIPGLRHNLYKWKRDIVPKQIGLLQIPENVYRYLTTDLPAELTVIRNEILVIANNYVAEEEIQYKNRFLTIHKNLGKTISSLKTKTAILSSYEFFIMNIRRSIDIHPIIDRDGTLLGVRNGVVRLGKKIEFISGYHEHFITKSAGADYTGKFDASIPEHRELFLRFRNSFPDDEVSAFHFIMLTFARGLDGLCKPSAFFQITGGGANGKTVLFGLFLAILGDYGDTAPPELFQEPKFVNADAPRSALRKALMARTCISEELPKTVGLNIALIKNICGGNRTFSLRTLFTEEEIVELITQFLFATNHPFKLSVCSYAATRRLWKYQMKIKYVEREPSAKFERKADPEMRSNWTTNQKYINAFFALLLSYREILEESYGNDPYIYYPSPIVRRETEIYRDDLSSVNKFASLFLVETKNEERYSRIETVITRYIEYLKSTLKFSNENDAATEIRDNFQSLIRQHPKTLNDYLWGHRVLSTIDEPLGTDEKKMTIRTLGNNLTEEKETPLETLERFMKNDIQPKVINIKNDEIKKDEIESDEKEN